MQKVHKKRFRSAVAIAATFAFTVSGIAVNNSDSQAASKDAPTLSVSSLSLKKGQTKKITVKAKKGVTIKKVTWKINNKKLKITKKGKKYIVVKALKTGSASISASIKTNKKTYTKKVKVAVTTKKKATPKPDITTEPDKTSQPDVTQAPADSDKPAVSDVPVVSDTPTVTDAPDVTEAPVESETPDATTAPAATTAPSAPGYITPVTPPEEFQEGVIAKTAWSCEGWAPGTSARKLTNLVSYYAGKKLRFSLKVKVSGETPAANAKINLQSNYNGYPNLAQVPLSTSWQLVEFEYRFNEFASNDPSIYFNEVPNGMNIHYKDFYYEIVDYGDPLGGTALTPDSWHKGNVASLRINENPKYYENKQVHISFKIRERGVEDPSGTCSLWVHGNPQVQIQSDIPLTTGWTTVDFNCTIGKITDDYPILMLKGDDITADMEMFVDDVSIEIIGDAPATPTPEATEAPSGEAEDINVPLTAANLYTSGVLENEDGSACTPDYGVDGSVTFTSSNKYSGGGMAFYLKNDKSAVDLSEYSGVKIVVEGTAERGLVIGAYDKAAPDNGIFTSAVTGTPKYPTLTGNEQEINIDFGTDTKWGGISAAYAIYVKYNGDGQGDYDNGDKIYTTVKIKSITFIAKEAPSTSTGDITVPLKAANLYTSGVLENEDGSACTPDYGADGSVTFTSSNKYSGGGMAFYLKNDKSAVDLSGYSGVKIVVEGTAERGLVIGAYDKAAPDNGIFTSAVTGTPKYPTLTGNEQEINIDFGTDTKWGGISEAYAIYVKYNGDGQGDYDNGDKIYTTVKIKSITLTAKE